MYYFILITTFGIKVWKMKCTIQQGKAKLNGTFHLPLKKLFVPLHKHYLFCVSSTNIKFLNKFEKKKAHWKMASAEAKHFTSCVSNCTWEVYHKQLRHAKRAHRTCWFSPGIVSHARFLIGLVCRSSIMSKCKCNHWVQ